MTEGDVIRFVAGLPGVVVVTAGEENGGPEAAWGDSFFFFDPDDDPANRRHPFATVVVKDYEGFDTASNLGRPGVYRLNVAVGRERFEQVVGWAPAEHAARSASVDHAVLDRVVPHPVYAAQGWVSVLCPPEPTRARSSSTHIAARSAAIAARSRTDPAGVLRARRLAPTSHRSAHPAYPSWTVG